MKQKDLTFWVLYPKDMFPKKTNILDMFICHVINFHRYFSQLSGKKVWYTPLDGVSLIVPKGSIIVPLLYHYYAKLHNLSKNNLSIQFFRHFYYLEPSGSWGRCEVVWKLSVRNLAKQPNLSGDTITFQLQQVNCLTFSWILTE